MCILAGGLGTRLGQRASITPKPLLEVAGQPFLLHQLQLLADHGAHEIVLSIGHLGDQIVDRIGSERFGLRIRYSHDGPQPLGTLGAIRHAAPLLGERFLYLYGDTYLRIDYSAAAAAWSLSGLPGLMTVLHNRGRWETSNAGFDGTLVTYDKLMPEPGMEWIDYGLGGLETRALDLVGPEVTDLAQLLRELSIRRSLFGFPATHRFHDIGTPRALAETDGFLTELGRAGADSTAD